MRDISMIHGLRLGWLDGAVAASFGMLLPDGFIDRATRKDLGGLVLRVASREDLLQLISCSRRCSGEEPPVIDPEALIALTIARGDMRLVHEVADWGIRHAGLLLVPRLRRYAIEIGAAEAAESWIATVSEHAAGVTWSPKAPFWANFAPSGTSLDFTSRRTDSDAASALRIRSLTGTHMRSEVLRSFHPVLLGLQDSTSSSECSWLALGTKSQVNVILDDAVRAGFVHRIGTER